VIQMHAEIWHIGQEMSPCVCVPTGVCNLIWVDSEQTVDELGA